MNKGKVSIIVPIYNVEKYLKRCVDSLINQTYTNLEIILIDDGSSDNSPEMCNSYAKEDSRIKVIHKKNGGLSDARNKGINIANGKYVMFIDSDDYVEIDIVETAVNAIDKFDSDFVIWGYYADFVNQNEEHIQSITYTSMNGVLNPNKEEFYLSSELLNLMGYAWNKLYKNEIIQKNNYRFKKGLSLVEDIVFNSEIFKSYHSISFIDKSLVHYMQRPRETLGGKFYEDQFELKRNAMDKVREMFLALGYNEKDVSNLVNKNLFNTLKTINRLLAQDKILNTREKVDYLSDLYIDENVIEVLENVHPHTFKDKIIKLMMKKNKFYELIKLYSLRTATYELGREMNER